MAEWSTSLHQTFRLLPSPSDNLQLLLESEGLRQNDVLQKMKYAAPRAGTPVTATGLPDPKRYRDLRQVFRSVGLLYELPDRTIRVTPLGVATRRWLDQLTPTNIPVLARFAVYSLAAWQLRNPLPEARGYPAEMKVFPYAFIWRVMLAAGGKINSMEMKCEVLRLTDEGEIPAAVERILEYRRTGDVNAMKPAVAVTSDDNMISWMGLASFGWALIADKKGSADNYWTIRPDSVRILERAADLRQHHRDFPDEVSYLEHIERAAAIPEDVR